ncbi:inosine triphosphate pyrophosphatase [Acrasis kona]|uniref:Inosine triphosphate pyrophosphatase n=1 Tax=Acrasis kona TaxID=1008807 RepID=A0AAW2Z786_9EUKA
MQKRTVVFVTGNANKLREVQQICGETLNVISHSVDLPELQGEVEDISKEKCKLAVKEIERELSGTSIDGVIVEDTSLCYNALGGLPGPYIKWFLDKTGHDGLNKILAGYEDKSAYALCTLSFVKSSKDEPNVFLGKTHGKIVPARGPNSFGWDPIFLPDGFDKTYAELDKDTKNSISHRYRAFEQLLSFLQIEQTK